MARQSASLRRTSSNRYQNVTYKVALCDLLVHTGTNNNEGDKMNKETENNLINTMARMIENSGDFTTYQQLNILDDLVNSIYVVNQEMKARA